MLRNYFEGLASGDLASRDLRSPVSREFRNTNWGIVLDMNYLLFIQVVEKDLRISLHKEKR